MRLRVDPPESLVDSPPAVWVEGVAPGSSVTLEITTIDAAGHRWRPCGRHRVGGGGGLGG